jgi:small subunit ribosomal protein S19e
MSIFEVNPTELILKTAEKLKEIKEIKPPAWASFAKTGHGKERPPIQNDWWYIRTASILRKIMLKGPIGVNKLKVVYGNRKNRGVKPERFANGSGSIIRKILQQLEKSEFLKKTEKDSYKGRILTPKGISFLEKTATEIIKTKPKKTETIKIQTNNEENKEKEIKNNEKKTEEENIKNES